MKSVIIEDELPAANRLKHLLKDSNEHIEVLAVLDSIKSSVSWFKNHDQPDLVFMDIHLADGYSFEIFKEIDIKAPVIFTTAYDEYALKAFEVNSVDYLLKPIDEQKLNKSIDKLKLLTKKSHSLEIQNLQQLIQNFQKRSQFKSRFLIRQNEQLITVDVDQIAYFMAINKLVLLVTFENRHFPVEYTLEELENQVNPAQYFRINRQFLANFTSVKAIHHYFNGKLKIELHPAQKEAVYVSREKASAFKNWLEGS